MAAAPAPSPAPAPSRANRTLPVGTEIKVSLEDSINSRRDSVGQHLSAHVMEEVRSPAGGALIAAGAPVRLTITKLEPAKSRNAAGKITFRVDGIEVGGQLQKISADVRPVQHELRGRGVTAGDAAKVGVGAAGGAVLGRVIGGNTKGAVIGGVVGAAGGAVVAHQTATRDVVVKARTPLVFVLTEPLVTP
ncbi:MAG TPA: glycine zipper 2TM domain-containing protein [Gemmatimonadales bacterium]|nr:glycine zipper 2TM domain-containing protein [Gemmatimonadales bacterium]